MGRRGPAPKPTVLKLLEGNPGKRPLNKKEPKPTGAPVLREDMSDASRAVWARVVDAYGHTGVLTAADGDALRIYCEAVVRYEAAALLLERSGPVVKGARSGDLVRNPLHQIVRDNAALVRAYARELGLTPSARSAITDVKTPGAEDPLERWMAGGS